MDEAQFISLMEKYRFKVMPEYDDTWLVFYKGEQVGKNKSLVVAVSNASTFIRQEDLFHPSVIKVIDEKLKKLWKKDFGKFMEENRKDLGDANE